MCFYCIKWSYVHCTSCVIQFIYWRFYHVSVENRVNIGYINYKFLSIWSSLNISHKMYSSFYTCSFNIVDMYLHDVGLIASFHFLFFFLNVQFFSWAINHLAWHCSLTLVINYSSLMISCFVCAWMIHVIIIILYTCLVF